NFASILSLTVVLTVSVSDAFFTDDYLFNVNWPGNAKSFANPDMYEQITMKTNNNEQFVCMLPTKVLRKDEHEEETTESQQSPLELLKPLFDQTACSYKIDVYWNYELCHGRHARQYHESKGQGAETSVTGFYLGYYRPPDQLEQKKQNQNQQPQTVLVEGQLLPYYEVTFTDGTLCDLSGQPRQSQVLYVCSLEGKGEIAELTETASCRYRIVVLARQLCEHPLYRPRRTHVNQLHCLPKPADADASSSDAGSSEEKKKQQALRKPAALVAMETAADRQVRASVQSLEGIFGADARVEILHKGGQVFIAVHSASQQQQQQNQQQQQQQQQQPTVQTPPQIPQVQSSKFFSGATCIVGGSTWWRHQVCFRKSIIQFHVFDDGRRSEIRLGEWNPDAHIAMATERNLLPVPDDKELDRRTELVQFYTDGDICDLTGKPRWTRLLLRCRGEADSPTAVSIAFAEHQTCQYTVTLEGRMLCPIIAAADRTTGLVPDDAAFDDAEPATP
ncbi:hypothetical protein BOX15_Mlig029395g1, partial [Macrostomum lignano]